MVDIQVQPMEELVRFVAYRTMDDSVHAQCVVNPKHVVTVANLLRETLAKVESMQPIVGRFERELFRE